MAMAMTMTSASRSRRSFGRKWPKKRISSSFLVYSILTIDMVMFSLATTTITTSYRNSVSGFMQWDAYCWREQCWGMLFCTSYHMILVVNIFTHIIIIWIMYMIRFIIMDILNHILILSRIFLLYCLFCVSVKDPSGIVLFLQVEKVVRYVEDLSGKGEHAWGHGHLHHRHNHSSSKKLKDDSGSGDESNAPLIETKNGSVSEMASDMNQLGGISDEYLNDEKHSQQETLLLKHNFTDGMALGGAFLLHGSVGGWSRTLFLPAHELPQEVGDFGILVRSGFSVSKALFFNFLSALVVLAGTALGFTAGGFIYIAVAGVLPEINSGSITFKSTVIQLMALTLGMAVALCISLVE